MSSIDKLLVRGIRSFSPYQENVIEFYSPLTIIVGHNGAGKTTVIECLKYATTGDLPPNAKGGAFVHDPKVSREVEVKGQIKLKFKNVRGQTMVCTRSLQSTQKKSKLEQKTLESLLSTTDPTTGEPVSISSRCAEMDAEVPLQLGVSRAVLENVLFCHQEESFWPLSEPSVLKKKFDDIFAATRYTKAVDTLKGLKKELAAELKLEQQKLDFLKADKEKAGKIRFEVEKATSRERDSRSRIAAIETQMESVTAAINRLTTELHSLVGLQAELERLMHDLEMAKVSKDDLLKGLTMMTEPDEILQRLLEEHNQRANNDDAHLLALKAEKSEMEDRISEESRRMNSKITELGVMEAEVERIEKRRSAQREQLAALCLILEIPFSATADLSSLIEKARQKIEELGQEHTRLTAKFAETERVLVFSIQQVGGKQSSLVEVRRLKRRMHDEAQIKLGNVIEQISECADAQEQIDDLQLQLLDEEGNFNQTKTFIAAANYEERLAALLEKRRELDRESSQMNQMIAASSRAADVRAKINLKRTECDRKTEALGKLQTELVQANEGLAAIPAESMEMECERLWRSKERELRELQERHENINQVASLSKSKLQHIKSILEKKQRELSDKQGRVQAACGRESFSAHFEEVERDLAQVTQELSSSLSSKATYEAFQTALGTSRSCPLCERHFDNRTEEELFGRKLAAFISSLPTKTLELRTRQEVLERQLSELKTLRPISDDVDRLASVEVPELQKEGRTTAEEATIAEANLDDINSELSHMILEEKRLASLKKRAEELARIRRELSAIQGEITSLEAELGAAGVRMSLEEIQGRLREMATARKAADLEIDQLQGEMRAKQNEANLREHRQSELKNQIMRLRLKEVDLTRLRQNKGDIEEQMRSLHEDISAADRDLKQLESELAGLQEERAIILATREQQLGELQRVYLSSESQFRRILEIGQEIEALEATSNAQAIERLHDERDALQARLLTLQATLNVINDRISLHGKATSEAIVQERNIRDNLRLRELSARIKVLEGDLSTMRERLGTFDRKTVSDQLQRHELRRSELLGERSGLFGELRQLTDQVGRFQHELDSEYRMIEEEYRAQYVRFTVTIGHDQHLIAHDDSFILLLLFLPPPPPCRRPRRPLRI